MWQSVLEAGLSNVVVASVLALLVFAVTRLWKNSHVAHMLWLLVLAKLVTPPLWHVSIVLPEALGDFNWSDGTAARNEDRTVSSGVEWADTTNRQYLQPAADDLRSNPVSTETLSSPPEQPEDRRRARSTAVPSTWSHEMIRAGLSAGDRNAPDHASWRAMVALTWMGGSLVWITVLSARFFHFNRILSQTLPATAEVKRAAETIISRLSLRRSPDLRITEAAVSPMVWPASFFRPMVVLPKHLVNEVDNEQLCMIVAHELGHVQRGDHWVRFLELAVVSLYWWNPLVWWVRRQLHVTEEACCDALVLRIYPHRAAAYGNALLHTNEFLLAGRASMPVFASGFGHSCSLKRRVEMILKNEFGKPASRAVRLALAAIAIGVLPMAARMVLAQGSATPQQPEPSATNRDVLREQNAGAIPLQATQGEAGNPFRQPACRVNGRLISYEELAKECIERDGPDVLRNMIDRVIIQQACAEAGITVTDTEMEREIVKIAKKFGLSIDQWFTMLDAERDLTPTRYRRDAIWPMLALKKLVGEDIVITDTMMKEAYVDEYGPRVKARMIVLNDLGRARDVWTKARNNPEEFERLAREYSVDPGSRGTGGKVSPIRRHSGVHEEVRAAAFKLTEVGVVSGIIHVDINKFAILKFEGRTEPMDQDFKSVQPQLREMLIEREVRRLVTETFKTLKEKARIDKYELSGDGAAGYKSRREAGEEQPLSREEIFELLEAKVDEISRLSREVEQLQAALRKRQLREQTTPLEF